MSADSCVSRVLVAALASLLVLASCAPPAVAPSPTPGGATAAAAPPSATPRPMLQFPQGHQGSSSDSALYIAIERGYFREEGLDPQLHRFTSLQDQVPPLAAGQLYVGSGAANVAFYNALAQGIPLRMVANKIYYPPGSQSAGWLVRTDLIESGRVKDPKDLKGLTVKFNPASSETLSLEILLQSAGLTLNDVVQKNVAYADLAAAFANKSIDVGYAFDPHTTNIVNQGLAKLWKSDGETTPNREAAVIVFSPVFMEKYPEQAKGWVVAWLRGVRDYLAAFKDQKPPDDVVAAMTKYGDQKDPAVVRATKPVSINPDGYNNKESQQRDLDFYVRTGQMRTAPDLNKAIDPSFVDFALARLGRYRP